MTFLWDFCKSGRYESVKRAYIVSKFNILSRNNRSPNYFCKFVLRVSSNLALVAVAPQTVIQLRIYMQNYLELVTTKKYDLIKVESQRVISYYVVEFLDKRFKQSRKLRFQITNKKCPGNAHSIRVLSEFSDSLYAFPCKIVTGAISQSTVEPKYY